MTTAKTEMGSKILLQMLEKSINEWYALAMKLHKHYNCHRCVDPTCCRIPVQLKEKEVLDLSLISFKKKSEFFREYMEVSPVGLYLKNPCPFLRKGKTSQCTVHLVRPFMCRMYPFSSMPGVLLNIDICPLAADIAKDLDRLRGKLIEEGYTPSQERTELENLTAEIAEELKAAMPEKMEMVEETANATENMFNMLDKLAPKSTLGDELHTSVQTDVAIFELLLEEKENA